MSNERFTLMEDTNGGLDYVLETMVKDNGIFLTHRECCDYLNRFYKENIQLKQLIHLMLLEIDVERVNSEDKLYSARFTFTKKEYELMKKLWDGD